MAIISPILRDTNNNVSLVRMLVSDNLATVASANYIKNNQAAINALNSGPWQWYTSDMILVSASDGNALFTFTNSTFASLQEYSGVASGIVTINGDTGSITGATVSIGGGTTGLTTSGSGTAMTLTGTLIVANGGTGKTSVTTAPAATSWAGWDANKNLSANSFIEGYATTATAAATTTLLVGSAYQQYFTGSTTQTVVLPVTSTLVLGQSFFIVNNSTGVVTVESSGANVIQAMAAGTSLLVTCILTSGTTAASWNAIYDSESSTGFATQVQVQQSAFNYTADTGVDGTAYVGTLSPVPAAYTEGLTVTLKPANSNSIAAPTLQLNGLSAVPIVNQAGIPLALGNIFVNNDAVLIYNSTISSFVLQNPVIFSADNTVVTTGTTGIPTLLAVTDGQLIIGSSAGAPLAATLTAGSGVTITNGHNSISIAASSGAGSPLTTKGDLYTFSTVNARLAVGATNGQILQVASAQTTGLAWSTPTYPSASGSAGLILRSNGTNNVYSTATFADTYAASTILYSNGANTVTGLATTNNAALATTAAGVPNWLALTDGQLVIGSSAGAPLAATITAGTGVTVNNGHNTITIASNGANPWVDQTGASVTMAANTGYTSDDGASLVTFTLPTSSAIGDWVEINGKGSGLWTIAQATGQQIHNGTVATTSGAGGSLASVNQYDCVRLRCLTANTIWAVVSQQSSGLTVV